MGSMGEGVSAAPGKRPSEVGRPWGAWDVSAGSLHWDLVAPGLPAGPGSLREARVLDPPQKFTLWCVQGRGADP